MPPLDAAEIQAFLEQSPFMRFSQMKVTRTDPQAGTIEIHAPLIPEFERGFTRHQWHGGPMAAVVDTAGDFALAMAIGAPLPTINFRIDYLRPATTDLTAIATVRRHGRTIGFVDVDLFNDQGTLVAIGRAIYSTTP